MSRTSFSCRADFSRLCGARRSACEAVFPELFVRGRHHIDLHGDPSVSFPNRPQKVDPAEGPEESLFDHYAFSLSDQLDDVVFQQFICMI